MPTVLIHAVAPASDADQVFATICDFGRYPALARSVREVQVTPVRDGVVDSTWCVEFRSGLLTWSERDHIDVPGRRIHFTQTAGDFEEFTGSWHVDQDGADSRICFRAEFDLGMPSLAAIIDPIATSTLVENIEVILRGLLRGQVHLTGEGRLRAAVPAQAAAPVLA